MTHEINQWWKQDDNVDVGFIVLFFPNSAHYLFYFVLDAECKLDCGDLGGINKTHCNCARSPCQVSQLDSVCQVGTANFLVCTFTTVHIYKCADVQKCCCHIFGKQLPSFRVTRALQDSFVLWRKWIASLLRVLLVRSAKTSITVRKLEDFSVA